MSMSTPLEPGSGRDQDTTADHGTAADPGPGAPEAPDGSFAAPAAEDQPDDDGPDPADVGFGG